MKTGFEVAAIVIFSQTGKSTERINSKSAPTASSLAEKIADKIHAFQF
jgi:hypothetical protein